ncbi:DNA-directed RNA polymerase subunit omega [bacterium]|nr:DNA-directed RNA polymerase subunit omega [candidate division CSSED10-310 bacterium]
MNEQKLEKWLGSVDSRHRAVLVVSKRAKQIQKGLRPYFDSKTLKVTSMALEEFVKGKVDWYELSQEEMDALRKDTLVAQESLPVVERPERPDRIEKREIKIFDDVSETESDQEDEETDDESDSDLDNLFPDADE